MNFENADVGSCSSCHVKNQLSSLELQVSGPVENSENTVQAQLNGITQSSYSWFYKAGINAKSILNVDAPGVNTNSVTIELPATTGSQTQTINVKYCIGQGVNGAGSSVDVKDYNCSEVDVTRLAAANNAPVLDPSEFFDRTLTTTGSDLLISITASDNNGDTLSYSVEQNLSGVISVSGSESSGGFNINIDPLSVGNRTVTVTVNDGNGGSDSLSFDVTVQFPFVIIPQPCELSGTCIPSCEITNTCIDPCVLTDTCPRPFNNPPVAQADSQVLISAIDSTLINVLVNDSDPEADDLTIVLVSTQSSLGGSMSIERGLVRYTPPAMLSQNDSFNYFVRDTRGLESDPVTVTLTPSDLDGDSIVDALDNCSSIPNSAQSDIDGDDLGDVCDADPDGDGIPGNAGQTLVSGRTLVESECLICHNNPSSGAPQFNDAAAWSIRLSTGVVSLVDSTINGRGLMPAFGSLYTVNELSAAVLYLSGSEGEMTGGQNDRDLDGVPDLTDNCPNFPNNDQSDLNSNGIGNVCEPTADNDSDGYPVLLDDDDSNANRLPGLINSTGVSGGLFLSGNQLRLGRLAELSAQNADYSSAGIVMSATDFLNAANTLRPEVNHRTDADSTNTLELVNLRINTLSGSSGELRVQLAGKLSEQPDIRVYDVEIGLWSDFTISPNDTLFSAATGQTDCPSSDSPNYSNALLPGVNCLRLLLSDGGPNDADGLINGEIEVLASISKQSNGPGEINLSPTKSGALGLVGSLVLLLMYLCRHGYCLTIRFAIERYQR